MKRKSSTQDGMDSLKGSNTEFNHGEGENREIIPKKKKKNKAEKGENESDAMNKSRNDDHSQTSGGTELMKTEKKKRKKKKKDDATKISERLQCERNTVNHEEKLIQEEPHFKKEKGVNSVNKLRKKERKKSVNKNITDKESSHKKIIDREEIAKEEETKTFEMKLAPKSKKARKKEKRRKMKRKLKIKEQSEDDTEGTKEGLAKSASLDYLRLWKRNRAEWKFQKVRQVWLLHNLFDEQKIPTDDFTVLLEYLEGLQGKSRETTLAEAEKIIQLAEDENEDVGETKQDRARQVIQLLS